ncbi:hypothetical protein EGW08_002958 [Elysia chlorotica]|uniref:Cadherin domain-containing protein n=1 Tax=Elysia chlorotica TaxID=188477 RepID=A0A433U652_ELYCH|nr:hypothetical protein EGW08_002958 [Elysia chlorotica]
MRYSFLGDDSEYLAYFKLDYQSGDLHLSDTKVLDREEICQFDAKCVKELKIAIQSLRTQLFRKVFVNIDIVDINDHSPVFKQNRTTVTISESVQIPSVFPLPSATDRDKGGNNSLQEYEIVPADGPFELSYSKDRPNLMLRVVKQLDHEDTESFFVRIIARDGGRPPREGVLYAEIVVEDENDNAPRFTQTSYEKTIDETVKQGAVLLTLTATDADSGKNGDVRYTLSPLQAAEIHEMFSLDAESGELKLVGDLQKAEKDKYLVGVEARDRADQPFTTQTWVTITVEDTINSPPRLILSTLSSEDFASTSEYANLGVAVAHLQVKDTDRGPNGIVDCNLTTPGYFELQSMDVKEYKVIVARQLDREDISIHNLTVSCYDAGSPVLNRSKSFQVHITDENDETPTFTQSAFRASFEENNREGQAIVTVTATDNDDPETKNAEITYSLRDDHNKTFDIVPESGTIIALKSFDYEEEKKINLTVVAQDNGIPKRSAVASVIITILDVNDKAPKFALDRFTVSVSEYASPGHVIGEISAQDTEKGENGLVEITIVPGSARRLRQNYDGGHISSGNRHNPSFGDFEDISDDALPFVMRFNGSIVLTKPVDHETCSQYQFEVLATDKGTPAMSSAAGVVIQIQDENDNPPRIVHPNVSETVFTAYAGREAPKTLTVFEVRDADSGSNGLVTYTITARNDSGRFEIDQLSGAVKRTKDLTGTDSGVYKLSVMVRDAGIPPLSDVRTLLIHVSGAANGTAGSSSDNEERYVVIAISLVCVTVLLSVTIVLVIVVMRRLDRRRKLHGGQAGRHVTGRAGSRGPIHIQNSAFMDPVKMDNFKNDQADRHGGSVGGNDGRDQEKRMNDAQFGFSPSTGSISSKKDGGDGGYQGHQVNNLNLPAEASREGDLDLEALQLRHVLLQTYQEAQARAPVPEDGASDSSGDTITSDSGRGGSDEDISNANAAAGNSMDDSRPGHNASFLSNSSTLGQNGSLKSSVRPPAKDPLRASSSSRRKHVTFQDMDRFRSTVRSQSATSDLRQASSTSSADSEDTVTLVRGPLAQAHAPPRSGSSMTSFGPGSALGGPRPRGHQNPLTEMNIPVNTSTSSNSSSLSPRGGDGSGPGISGGIRRDNPAYNSFGGYPQAKNNPRGPSSTIGRDSPVLQTFLPSSMQQPPFSNMTSPRLPFYEGGDTTDSLPRAWRDSPRSNTSSNNLNSSNSSSNNLPLSSRQQQLQINQLQQPYVQMSSPRDRLNPQPHPALPKVSLSARNSPRSPDPQMSRGHESLPTSPRVNSPTPLLPPRESVAMDNMNKNINHNSLLGNDSKNFRSYQQQYPHSNNKMASFLGGRDWTTDSIATTEDCDDQRSTTTSGSYTIDNEEDYLTLEFKPKDVVV